MGKILAIDFGTKRVGYAISDEKRTIAFPRGVISATPEKKCLAQFLQIIKEERVDEVVIGVPLGSDNEETAMSKRARNFSEKIEKASGLKINYVDEWQSSEEAISKIPLRKNRRDKNLRNAIAAQIILKRYLGNLWKQTEK